MKNLQRIIVVIGILCMALYSCGSGGGSSKSSKRTSKRVGSTSGGQAGGGIAQGVCPSLEALVSSGEISSRGISSSGDFTFIEVTSGSKNLREALSDATGTEFHAAFNPSYDESIKTGLVSDCVGQDGRIAVNFNEVEGQEDSVCEVDFYKCTGGNNIGTLSTEETKIYVSTFYTCNLVGYSNVSDETGRKCYHFGTAIPGNCILRESPVEAIDLYVDPGIDSLGAGGKFYVKIDEERPTVDNTELKTVEIDSSVGFYPCDF